MRRDLLRGSILALAAGTACLLVARYGFGRLYYLSSLLAAVLVTFLLLAWLIHLRSDGFLPKAKREEPAREDTPYASFHEEVITRKPSHGTWDSRDVQRALLWAAGELLLLSIALYHFAGIGARY